MSESGFRRSGGLRSAFAELIEGVVGLAGTRVRLAGVELAEERDRLVARAVLLVAGILLIAVAALFAGAFVIVLFWDTHRLIAIATVTVVLAVAGTWMLLRARTIGRNAPRPFAATLAELEKDRVLISRAVRGEGVQD